MWTLPNPLDISQNFSIINNRFRSLKNSGKTAHKEVKEMKKIVLIIMFLAILLAPMMEVFGENQEVKKEKKTYVKPEFILVMTNEPGGKAIDEFDCREKVYVELTLPKISDKRHKIEAFWFGPGPLGSREYAEYEFDGNYAYLWLKLPGGRGLFSGGAEDYIGKWKVKIHLDGKFLERKVFYMAC